MIRAAAALTALGLALAGTSLAQERPPSTPSPDDACLRVDDATVTRLRDDVAWLSDDARGGREPGTDGAAATEDFLVRRMTELGLEPAGTEGYRQPLRVDYGVEDDPRAQVLVKVGDTTRALRPGEDFRVAGVAHQSGDGRGVGAVVFAGHGLSSREAGWDDFARGARVRGRVVVVLAGPPRPGDPARAERLRRAGVVGSLDGKVRAARRLGAAALVEVQLAPREPALAYVPAPTGGGIPVVRVSRAVGAWMLGRAEAALAPASEEAVVARIPGASARVVTATRRRSVTVSNVLGRVRGVGGAGRAGALVVGAHQDHVGHGGASSLAPGVWAIHNGADDNASGTAAVLELARRVRQTPASHDVVFALFAAEELGLVGSRWLVAHRPPGMESLAAVFNLDMVGRLRACRLFVESRGTAPALASVVEEANRGFGFDARPWEPWRGAWGASDHMSFHDARVPGLFFFTGLHDDYHRPSDDLPTLSLRGLGAVTAFAEAALRGVDRALARDPASMRYTR